MRDTIDMAREACCDEIHVAKILAGIHFKPHALKAFEALVRADERSVEREACAKVVEASPSYDWHRFACEAAAAIRARGETK